MKKLVFLSSTLKIQILCILSFDVISDHWNLWQSLKHTSILRNNGDLCIIDSLLQRIFVHNCNIKSFATIRESAIDAIERSDCRPIRLLSQSLTQFSTDTYFHFPFDTLFYDIFWIESIIGIKNENLSSIDKSFKYRIIPFQSIVILKTL